MDENTKMMTKAATDIQKESTPLLPVTFSRPAQEQTSELLGYLYMFASSLCFSGMSIFVRIAEDRYNFPITSAVFIRGITITLLASVHIANSDPVHQSIKGLTSKQSVPLAFRGIFGGLGLTTLYLALNKLPAGEAVTIFSSTPVITMLLSYLVLGESITFIDLAAAAMSFIGVLLVAHLDIHLHDKSLSSQDRILGTLYATAAASFSAAAYVTVRSLGTSVHFMLSVVANSLAAIVMSVAFGGALGPEDFFTHKEASFIVVLSSLLGFGAQSFLNKGLQLCRAGTGMLIRNLDVAMIYLLGILFLGEAPSALSIVGSLLVLIAGIMIGWGKIVR